MCAARIEMEVHDVSVQLARLTRWAAPLTLLMLCGLLHASPASAAKHELRPSSTSQRLITFKLRAIKPSEIRSATLYSTSGTRRMTGSVVRKAAKSGTLRLRRPSRRGVRAARAGRSKRRPTRLVVVTDTSRPTVRWLSPSNEATVSGVLSANTCRASASDKTGVRHVDFQLDGARLIRDAKAPYTCRWDTRTAKHGWHTLSAVAVDRAGRTAKSSIRVMVGGGAGEPGPGPQPPAEGLTPITGTTYYVSATGSDSADGRSTATAWRTVGKANAAALQPGDGVLFEGGKSFSDRALSPSRSGSASNRIVYGAYGTGKASLPKGVYLLSVDGLAFQNLSISGLDQAVLASGSGSGVSHVTLEHLAISDVAIAINSANAVDANWTIRNNSIARTGDSGMILFGERFTVTNNTISTTGTDGSIGYGKHAIYLKVIDAQVTYNDITDPGASGISVRYRNSVLEHNTIRGGEEGIAWYQYDAVAGTSYWRHNTISDTTGAGIYVSDSDRAGATRESFVISNNTLSKRSGVFTNLHKTSGTYSVFDNLLR